MFSELDVKITREEIQKNNKTILKTGKSGGPDQLNESLIRGQYVPLPCLHSLFNKL